MKPIIVDIHYLLASEETREYAFFFRINFQEKDLGDTMEGPFKITPPPKITSHKKAKKWEQVWVLLRAMSLVRQRIRASLPAPDKPIIVYTDYRKFAKVLVNFPRNLPNLPPAIGAAVQSSVDDLGQLDMQIVPDGLPWRLRYNGRKLLRKFISGGLEQNVIQQRFTIPEGIKQVPQNPEEDSGSPSK